MSKVVFRGYSAQIRQQMRGNVQRALLAIGTEAVGRIVRTMRDGYGAPIRQTGNLMADVHCEAEGSTVTVGNALEYALYVHEGTSKMKGRPYIRDALLKGDARESLQRIAEAYLKDGF